MRILGTRILGKTIVVLALVAALGCGVESGRIVSPEYLSGQIGGGSYSTVWYHGSDDKYHYFSHLYKTSTPYRIKKTDLKWDNEYPRGSRESLTLVTTELSAPERENAEQVEVTAAEADATVR